MFLIKEGLIIFSLLNNNGNIGILPKELNNSIISNSFCSFEFKENEYLLKEYLILILKQDKNFKLLLEKNIKSGPTNRKRLDIKNLLEQYYIDINKLPSLKEQKQILKDLKNINKEIEILKLKEEKILNQII